MSIAKVLELIAEGKTVEDCIESALKEASKTIQNIQQIDVEHIHAKIENNKVVSYRVDARVSFIVNR